MKTLDDVLRDMGSDGCYVYRRDDATVVMVVVDKVHEAWSVYVDNPPPGFTADQWASHCNSVKGLAGRELAAWVRLDPIAAQSVLCFVFSGEPLTNPVMDG